jgi:hypothetical protein
MTYSTYGECSVTIQVNGQSIIFWIFFTYTYNVFQLPEGTPPPMCRLARPARWRFETILLGMLYIGYTDTFLYIK